MRTYGNLFERMVSFDNLYAAYRAARRGKRGRPDVAAFEMDCEGNLLAMRQELLTGTYRFGPYRDFIVKEPRERLVSAAPFRDRIMHHALVRVLEPIWEPRFIHDSYACRKGRGTHRAILKCQQFVRDYPLALKIDIWKFYPTVDHAILLEILGRRVRDSRILSIAKNLLAVRSCRGWSAAQGGRVDYVQPGVTWRFLEQ
ncbi:MAG: reverse transcriptase domain-containing protein [Candidatus Eisenbacteria bacterium]|nr:reverse transcriptase domain-containing protein [Candidatus Eisenbacteria bacterium]